tara:strand:+ start:760 stop:1020 length:261 start_codon:yes stop_codon:yes gene_type:complete
MRQYIYKIIIAVIAIIITFEFTIGKELKQLNEKFDIFGSPEGRKKVVSSIKKEIRKANDKENYLEEDEKVLIRNFIIKIKKELDLN